MIMTVGRVDTLFATHINYRVMQLWSFGWMFYRVYCSDLVIFSLMQLIQFWYAIYR